MGRRALRHAVAVSLAVAIAMLISEVDSADASAPGRSCAATVAAGSLIKSMVMIEFHCDGTESHLRFGIAVGAAANQPSDLTAIRDFWRHLRSQPPGVVANNGCVSASRYTPAVAVTCGGEITGPTNFRVAIRLTRSTFCTKVILVGAYAEEPARGPYDPVPPPSPPRLDTTLYMGLPVGCSS